MNTAVLTVKVEPAIKKEAQDVARNMGLSLSALINGYLRQIIKTRTAVFSTREEPTVAMLEELRESIEDVRLGRSAAFDTGKEALDYLDTIINHEKKRKTN